MSAEGEFNHEMAAKTTRAGAVSRPEMDAAAALLELHGLQEPREHKSTPAHTDSPKPTDNLKKLGLNVEKENPLRHSIDLKVTVTSGNSKRLGAGPSGLSSQKSPTIVKLPCGGYIVRNNPAITNNQPFRVLAPPKKRLNLHKKYLEEQRRWSKEYKSKMRWDLTEIVLKCDVGTQTELNVDKMETVIKELCAKISDLEQELTSLRKSPEKANKKRSFSEDDDLDDEPTPSRRKYLRRAKSISGSNESNTSPPAESDDDDDDSEYTVKVEKNDDEEEMSEEDDSSCVDEREYSKHVRKSNGATVEMVAIGDGNASVPARLLKQLDWSSYTNATRKLLTAVFSRRVLATHSLTGKPSPAFPDKPAKKKLDAALVSDIVQTVVERCKVPENVVRTSITTKCADESKMFRCRQQNKNKRLLSKKENMPPSPGSRDSNQDS